MSALREEIGKILGLSLPKKTILIGAGNLGRAILAHMAFAEKGFSIVGIFDRDEDFSGEVLEGIPIRHTDELEQFCQKEKPTVGHFVRAQNGVTGFGSPSGRAGN